MGWFNCPFCRRSWKNIQKVYKHLPAGVQILYVDWTEGVWGGDQVSPEEEAAHIRHYVLERKKYTFPFAIWAGPRDSTSDGGSQPRVMPLWREFDLNAGPSWLVVDGHGVVRGIFYGDNGIDEFNAMRVVRYLITERAHAENHS
jgi:hypothetical protein